MRLGEPVYPEAEFAQAHSQAVGKERRRMTADRIARAQTLSAISAAEIAASVNQPALIPIR